MACFAAAVCALAAAKELPAPKSPPIPDATPPITAPTISIQPFAQHFLDPLRPQKPRRIAVHFRAAEPALDAPSPQFLLGRPQEPPIDGKPRFPRAFPDVEQVRNRRDGLVVH